MTLGCGEDLERADNLQKMLLNKEFQGEECFLKKLYCLILASLNTKPGFILPYFQISQRKYSKINIC